MATNYYYYPSISDLITPDDWPEILPFLKDDINQIIDNLYYKNSWRCKKFRKCRLLWSRCDPVPDRFESSEVLAIAASKPFFCCLLNGSYVPPHLRCPNNFPLFVHYQRDCDGQVYILPVLSTADGLKMVDLSALRDLADDKILLAWPVWRNDQGLCQPRASSSV